MRPARTKRTLGYYAELQIHTGITTIVMAIVQQKKRDTIVQQIIIPSTICCVENF
jgi:hypothetical protein